MYIEINNEALKNLPAALNTIGNSPLQVVINRPTGIRYNQFIWVTKNSGEFTVSGNSFILKTGEGVFIPANTPHSYHASTSSGFSTSWFTFTMPTETLECIGLGNYIIFDVPLFLEREHAALDSFAQSDCTPLSRAVNTYALISAIIESISAPSKTLADKTRQYLETHYSEPLSLDLIANAVGSNRFSLCHFYKKQRGISVIAELNEIRIAKAKRFLKYTSYTVSQIANMCGFENAGYFAKCFKDSCGMSPIIYRETK